eukprot:CAMPEP_0113953596 /NCGR_PEP_ID=MMETSP1339-20121228/91051_1 /TAXON_ID=94617 /ORGANISM="Fibrocapsa japonica" /LENGTH=547 /DNA_ID=CAMNT_0000962335 /DNA_START=72 /DNA_END=1715 /DNA_ORIENTATION=+ /assembly_acc=CAM_ASM_000762
MVPLAFMEHRHFSRQTRNRPSRRAGVRMVLEDMPYYVSPPIRSPLGGRQADKEEASPFSPSPSGATPEESNDPSLTFGRLGLDQEITQSMEAMGFTRPSKIQAMAIPQVMTGGNMVFAAATGSGKTLAYLLPVIQQLRAQEAVAEACAEAAMQRGEVGLSVRAPKRPRAVVLVPTRELAAQVLAVTKQIGRYAKVSCCSVVGGEDYGKQARALAGTVDLVVATPGRLLMHRNKGGVYLSKVTHVVVDEVDTMLTQGFGPDIRKLTAHLIKRSTMEEGQDKDSKAEDKVQFLLTTATLTKAVKRLLTDRTFPQPMGHVETRDLHRTLPNLKHVMVDCKGSDKITVLLDVLYQHKGKQAIVFCNTVASCRAAEHAVREAGLTAQGYHGEINSIQRRENIDAFKNNKFNLLVCTDLASRGLDMPTVDHVVMFDFPLNPIDFLHRSGRTARMGRHGLVTSILTKGDRVLATAIERAILTNMPLDQLSSRKQDYGDRGKLHHMTKVGRRKAAKAPKNKRGNNHSRTPKAEKESTSFNPRKAGFKKIGRRHST